MQKTLSLKSIATINYNLNDDASQVIPLYREVALMNKLSSSHIRLET